MSEVREVLEGTGPGTIDWLTVVGSGEPTLHSGLGRLIRSLEDLSSIPVAVITNGALLIDPEVRADLIHADAVLPSVDAGSARLHRRVNRPDSNLDFEAYIGGLELFRREYGGQLWVEVMLVRGLNDSEEELLELGRIMSRVKPDQIHLNQPTRPPCEPWVEPTDDAGLERAARILGPVARVVVPSGRAFRLMPGDDVAGAIESIVARHPMPEAELMEALSQWDSSRIRETLEALLARGNLQVVEHLGHRFWSGRDSRYVPESIARCRQARESSGT